MSAPDVLWVIVDDSVGPETPWLAAFLSYEVAEARRVRVGWYWAVVLRYQLASDNEHEAASTSGVTSHQPRRVTGWDATDA